MTTLAYGRLGAELSLTGEDGATPTVAAPGWTEPVAQGLVVSQTGRNGSVGENGAAGVDTTTYFPPYGLAGGNGWNGARGGNGQDVSRVVNSIDPTVLEIRVEATGGNGGNGGGGGAGGRYSTYRTVVPKVDNTNRVIWEQTTDRSGAGGNAGDGGNAGRGGHAKSQIVNLDVDFQNGGSQVELVAFTAGGGGSYGGWGSWGEYGRFWAQNGFTFGDRYYITYQTNGSAGGHGGDAGDGGMGGYATSRIVGNDIGFVGVSRIGLNAHAFGGGGGSAGNGGQGGGGGMGGGAGGDGGNGGNGGVAIAEVTDNLIRLSGTEYSNVFINAQAVSEYAGNYGGSGGVAGYQISHQPNTETQIFGQKAEDGGGGNGGAGGKATARIVNNVIDGASGVRSDNVGLWAEARANQGGTGGNRWSDSQNRWVQDGANGAMGTSAIEIINNRVSLGAGNDTINMRVYFGINATQTLTLSRNVFDGGADHDTFNFQAEAGRVIDFTAGGTVNGVSQSAITLLNFEQVNLSDANEIVQLDGADTNVWAGKGADKIYGGGGNDGLGGGEGDDVLHGEAGDDWLSGGLGADRLEGGDGRDTANYRQATSAVRVDVVGDTDVGEAIGDVFVSIEAFNLTDLGDRFIGGSAAEIVYGNAGNDAVYGQDGGDVLWGGGGDDLLDGGSGYDTVRYNDAGAAVTVNLLTGRATGGAGTDTLRNIENASGSVYNDTFIGNATDNWFWGLQGDDVYEVGARDRVFEVAGEGYDTVRTTVTFRAEGQHIERIEIIGTAAVSAFGNELDNVLIGNDRANALDGGLGIDRMSGGKGDDLYVVDNAGDLVTELAGEGTDTVRASISYALTANVENLLLLGSAGINGVGNDLRNTITGNAAANVIVGKGGADVLFGKGGADRFDFNAVSESSFSAYDRIGDLQAIDIIDLSTIDANTTIAGNQAFQRVDAFTGAGQFTMTYLAASNLSVLAADVNGDGVADMRIVMNGDHRAYDNFIL